MNISELYKIGISSFTIMQKWIDEMDRSILRPSKEIPSLPTVLQFHIISEVSRRISRSFIIQYLLSDFL